MGRAQEIGIMKVQEFKKDEKQSFLIIKRLIDVSVSLIAMIIAAPIMIIVAVMIKLEDPTSPVIFTQERNGVNGKIFKMYKFRSMYTDAEERLKEIQHLNEQTGPVFKIKDDPRITKVGRFIRKTSLDELPQFLNVLKGEMSIVGPRPALPREVAQYNEYQMQRLLVKPGITCIWQVSGRNHISFEQWVEMDIEYIKTRNLMLDLKLILLTIPALFGDKNAS